MHTPTDSYDFYMVSSWLQQPGLSSREHKAVTLKAAIFCYQGAFKVTFKLEGTSWCNSAKHPADTVVRLILLMELNS